MLETSQSPWATFACGPTEQYFALSRGLYEMNNAADINPCSEGTITMNICQQPGLLIVAYFVDNSCPFFPSQ